jgi:hypothetical protein
VTGKKVQKKVQKKELDGMLIYCCFTAALLLLY